MHTHVVLYKAYKKNPRATTQIIRKANQLIKGKIPGIEKFHIKKVLKTNRAVTSADYDVMMTIVFKNTRAYRRYVTHENHMAFARFMLRGYMLTRSTAEDRTEEFIQHVLHGKKRRLRVRNPEIPDSEVVWGGEIGFDAA